MTAILQVAVMGQARYTPHRGTMLFRLTLLATVLAPMISAVSCGDDEADEPIELEDTANLCNDDFDNDEDGLADCDGVSGATEVEYYADPDCCVLDQTGAECEINEETWELCPHSDADDPPTACDARAEELGCDLL